MSAATETADSVDDLSELELFGPEETIRLMNLTGVKTARWLLDQVRADRLFFTPVGKTPMFSRQDIRDNIARMRHSPRNKFLP